MKILLDTNILIHAYNRASRFHGKAADVIRKALRGEIEVCLTPQILYEFFAVVTNPGRVEHPLSADEAADICLDLWECREIGKASLTATTPMKVFKLVRRLNLSGGKVFDCVLAVTAKENGVEKIYTENVEDFEFYDFLKVSNPLI